MTLQYYILRGHDVVEATYEEWERWITNDDVDEQRRVGHDIVGDSEISTVMLSTIGFVDRPFETMIFGGPHDLSTFRYDTWDQAVKGHATIVKLLTFIEEMKNVKPNH